MDQWIEQRLEAWQRGDPLAVDELVDRLYPALLRFFLAMEHERSDAEDLVQETWIRLHKARHSYRPGSPALPWIYAVARHMRLDHLRKRMRVKRKEVGMEVLPEIAVVEKLDGKETEIGALLDELPEAQREAVVLTKVNGLSLEEAARATGSTVGAVKQKVFRAYEKIRALAHERGLR